MLSSTGAGSRVLEFPETLSAREMLGSACRFPFLAKVTYLCEFFVPRRLFRFVVFLFFASLVLGLFV